jgi:hypothetical protein
MCAVEAEELSKTYRIGELGVEALQIQSGPPIPDREQTMRGKL